MTKDNMPERIRAWPDGTIMRSGYVACSKHDERDTQYVRGDLFTHLEEENARQAAQLAMLCDMLAAAAYEAHELTSHIQGSRERFQNRKKAVDEARALSATGEDG